MLNISEEALAQIIKSVRVEEREHAANVVRLIRDGAPVAGRSTTWVDACDTIIELLDEEADE